ncbi:MAG: LamG domain-containing protein, partial [Victivallaceae bacterium]|nr:LamG domain-containing protein [Victivallaceae bacterium]
NVLGCNNKGFFVFDIWKADRKAHVQLRSKKPLTLKKSYDVAGSVAVLPDGKTEIKLYINGIEEAKATFAAAPYPYPTDLFLGAANPGGEPKWHFAGSLSDVRIFDRALTAEEIARLGK